MVESKRPCYGSSRFGRALLTGQMGIEMVLVSRSMLTDGPASQALFRSASGLTNPWKVLLNWLVAQPFSESVALAATCGIR